MLKIELTEKPTTKPILIEGFPGFGFVSTIATEYLIKHLGAKSIGKISSDKVQPIAAIHKGELINPLGIFYDKKSNILIVQAVTPVDGLEWELAETINELVKQLKVKEIIGLEGVNSEVSGKDPKVFFYSKAKTVQDKLNKLKILPLEEGIIIGVTGALLMKTTSPLSCFFVEAHSQMPDNKAAAKLIDTLDKYLKLQIDTGPLVEKAKEFEVKIKDLMTKVADAKSVKEDKALSYMG
ncbi:MAG: PAC2 family protein [Candidatus Pacearchaeota archaeon]|nr:PAC2 family protein [Candidatus Pacearchaeota archaeon]